MYNRHLTKPIKIGAVTIGGDNPIAIQSMTNTDTRNPEATVRQILELEEAGCEIARIAVPDMEAANMVDKIKSKINIPLVADIHFDYRLALAVMERGIDKLRINPGNIGSPDRIKQVVQAAKQKNIPIRIGVNSGSLEKDLLEKFGGVTPEGLTESALRHVKILEDLDFDNIVISVKASSVPFTLNVYSQLSQRVNYPLHIGITESGTEFGGSIKSAVGIGSLLAMGIGDTLRVSLTSDPVKEIYCAKEILKALELRQFGVNFVSCPTCGRTRINLIELAGKVEEYCKKINKPITVAVMGCEVNGPGEAKEAHIGIAAGNGFGVIFKKGQIIRKVPESQLFEELIKELENL